MRWSEVESLMSEVAERVSPKVRLFFGAAVDASMAGAISVTLLAGIPGSAAGEALHTVGALSAATRVAVAPPAAAASTAAAPSVRGIHTIPPENKGTDQPDPARPPVIPAEIRHELAPAWEDLPPPAPDDLSIFAARYGLP